MQEVSQEAFYDKINPLDVIVSCVGKWPYTSLFKTRYTQTEVGRVTQNDIYPIKNTYFLTG